MKIYYLLFVPVIVMLVVVFGRHNQVEYIKVEVPIERSNGEIIRERVESLMSDPQFIEEMKHIAIARVMLGMSREYLEQAEVLQHASQENMQRGLLLSSQFYESSL